MVASHMRAGSVDQNGSMPDEKQHTEENSARNYNSENNQTEVLKMKESINPNNQMETSSTDKMEKNREYWRMSAELSITFRQQQRKII